MDIKELIDEDAFDPENLFDKKKFITMVINREGFSKREGKAADLLEALLDRDITRAECEEIYAQLKETNARETMLEAIRQATNEQEKALLIQACWECGLDFTPHFLLFAELATLKDYSVALEALTVLQNCDVVDNTVLDDAINLAAQATESRSPLLAELRAHLAARKNAQ
jgi:hypothetical protein